MQKKKGSRQAVLHHYKDRKLDSSTRHQETSGGAVTAWEVELLVAALAAAYDLQITCIAIQVDNTTAMAMVVLCTTTIAIAVAVSRPTHGEQKRFVHR